MLRRHRTCHLATGDWRLSIPTVACKIIYQSRIAWNGVLSSSFEVLNGVKQGGVLSPVLFCVSILMGCWLHLRMLVLDVILGLSLLVCWHTLMI